MKSHYMEQDMCERTNLMVTSHSLVGFAVYSSLRRHSGYLQVVRFIESYRQSSDTLQLNLSE